MGRHRARRSWLLVTAAVGLACSESVRKAATDVDCSAGASAGATADATATATSTPSRPLYAENFRIERTGSVKRLTIRKPWPTADFSLRYDLIPCGAEAPAEGADAVIRIPPGRFVTTSSTQIPHVEALGLIDRLVGHNRFDYVTSETVRARIESGLMREVGDGVYLNEEVLLDLRPDLVFVFSIGSPELDVLSGLEGTGIPYAVDAAWVEATPLARAEWIKVTAAFFDREAEAEEIFAEISGRYEELVRLVGTVEERPSVLVGAPFRGTWYVAGGASFQARLIADAGGRYLWAEDDSSGSLALDLEAVYSRALDADVWLHPTDWRSLEDGRRSDERMADFRPFSTGRVFNNDLRMNGHGGNDYWGSGSLRADLVLQDFIRILHPGLLPDHELIYHRALR